MNDSVVRRMRVRPLTEFRVWGGAGVSPGLVET